MSKDFNSFEIKSRIGFIKFVDKHYVRLYKYGFTITHLEYVVEDNVQEAFLILWKKRNQIRNPQAAFFYLMKTLKSKVIRDLEEYRKYLPEDILPIENLKSESPEQIWIHAESENEKLQLLKLNLTKLPDKQRHIITLHFLEQKSFDEICKIMNIGRQSAYNLMSRSLKNLKSKF
ncbi:RNA polymerase sigma factor [Membranihabitans maritimus]|uniref:RNA polymerase sigma factor n=1 Tax=Membranihabitans maritimus TaxID=2904244 RepID=UPI001F1A0F9A|nr:sigma-70 family RNA polymerase sigma factor [Membranihabitans maritimus]